MRRILQIMQACDGWEAGFFSYDDGDLFCEPVLCWALVSETLYAGRSVPRKPRLEGVELHNDDEDDEKRYIEGQVIFVSGCNIVGVYGLPQYPEIQDLHGEIGFLGYLNTRLPEKYRREQMEYFKKEAEGLMEMRKSGRLPTIEPEIPR
jgi:hypothetical protein